MNLSDFLLILRWWVVLFTIGIVWFPLMQKIFSSFSDKGYLFGKVIGTLIISYVIYIVGILHIATFTNTSSLLLAFIVSFTALFLGLRKIKSFKIPWKFVITEEILFFLSLLFWSYIRAFQPDIHGLEKFMDFGFVNSILRSSYFPPKDMWYPPYPINYYYFGHLVTAVLTRLSQLPSFITFNLMIATLFSFCLTLSFSLGFNIAYQRGKALSVIKSIIAASIGSLLLTFGGNLQTIYAFFKSYTADSPPPFWQLPFQPFSFPNMYWYPNATRFIYHTIHEFPMYSFVVSDLHGHVLDIPVVLTIIAFLFHIILRNKKFSIRDCFLLGFLLAVTYMTNAWDAGIYLLLTGFVFIYVYRNDFSKRNKEKLGFLKSPVLTIFLIITGFIIVITPFNHFFNASKLTGGIGLICAPSFLTKIGKIGPFLFEPDHCLRSPIWQLGILWGFFYFWAIFFVIKVAKTNKNPGEIFLLILTALATLLIIVPEFIYLKDIYPTYYRANTMFKLVYQAFIMLSLVGGYSVTTVLPAARKWAFNNSLRRATLYLIFFTFALILLSLVSIYPFFAINSYYGNLKTYVGLDGIKYLKTLLPGDYQAILWINDHIKGQPVMLEAQGDSYTDYERISANTGLPTVLGWTVHEWLWRGSYAVDVPRIQDVEVLYESTDKKQTDQLIKKYNIQYIYIGILEREKYPHLQENKLKGFGGIVYHNPTTEIIEITKS